MTKLVALRPGSTVREMIKSVMQGKDEGQESSEDEEAAAGEKIPGIFGRVSYPAVLAYSWKKNDKSC